MRIKINFSSHKLKNFLKHVIASSIQSLRIYFRKKFEIDEDLACSNDEEHKVLHDEITFGGACYSCMMKRSVVKSSLQQRNFFFLR